ncbi:DUF6591 domain-containing protein [Dysgonomonas sp.]
MKRILSFIVLVCLLYSCSDIPKEKEVTVSDVEITGFIKDYVKVVPGSYKFTNDGNDALITVKFELIAMPNYELCRKKHPEDISINPISETGDILDANFTTNRMETAKLKDLLNNGKLGDTKSISFKWRYFGNKSNRNIAKLIFTKTNLFEIVDETFKYCTDLTEDDTHWDDMSDNVKPNTVKESKIEANVNWDEALNEYEKYVDGYIRLIKKANAGDITAIADYPDIIKNAESLGNKLSNAKGAMTTSQLKRYMEIQTKMASAIE